MKNQDDYQEKMLYTLIYKAAYVKGVVYPEIKAEEAVKAYREFFTKEEDKHESNSDSRG